ncbi:MAG: class I SAM-dependent methyltransferase [Janthinobacterium lividum]
MTAWHDGALRSPVSGDTLRPDTPHSLAAGQERWPVVDGIPFLRADRRGLADAALDRLDGGDPDGALVLLLADQDNWARSAPPDEASRRSVVRNANALSFRAAMDLLAFGPVGTYFAHRWSDPTFLSGLALAEAHRRPGPVLELACGAGHFLREFARMDEAATGGDIVFAKLWLARRYVSPAARLVCFDAAAAWPFGDSAFETVFCHDAFYFLPDKPHVAAEMRRVGRLVLVGHAHNALVDNLSSGQPMTPDGYAALFEGAVLYDDRELTAALVGTRAPRPAEAAELAVAPALSWAVGAGPARAVSDGMAMPTAGAGLRRNPLYRDGAVVWPSDRYKTEYAALATYPLASTVPNDAVMGTDPATDALARRRALLDLPPAW